MMERMAQQRFGAFDFGLSTEQEERAARLHRESVVVDMLFQGPFGPLAFTDDLVKGALDEAKGKSPEEVYGAVSRAPVRAALRGELPEFEEVWRQSGITAGNRQAPPDQLVDVGLAQAQFDGFPWLRKALRADDIRRAKADGALAGFVSTQNATWIDPDLVALQAAYDMGMRMVGLSYNVQNLLAGGCTERFDGGVTNFGAQVISRMDDLGIIVDMAHSGRQAALDACRLSRNPVVASHTSARVVFDADRAKDDDVARAIASTGGVLGVVAVPFFLAAGTGVTIDAMLDHIDHLAALVGWEHVAIGTDWPLQADTDTLVETLMPMVLSMGFREEHNIDPVATLVGFDDYRDFPNITRGLVARGYTDTQVEGILGENFLRVFAAVCG
jgi:membrane dipeptidase